MKRKLGHLVARLRTVTHDGTILIYAGLIALAIVAVFYFGRTVIRKPWIAREDFSVAVIGGTAYVFGGTSRAPDEGMLDEILELDLTRQTVRLASRLPWPSLFLPVAALGDSVYVLGGAEGGAYRDEVLRFRPETGELVPVGRLPSPRGLCDVTALAGRLYTAGGWDGTACLDDVVEFDPATGASRVVGWLPSPRQSAAVAAVEGRIYVIGGEDALGEMLDEIVEFDPSSGEILRVGRLPSPRSRTAACAFGDEVFLFGGKGEGLLDEIARFRPTRDPIEVEIVGRLPEASVIRSADAVDNRIFLFGGTWLRREQDRQFTVRALIPGTLGLRTLEFRGDR